MKYVSTEAGSCSGTNEIVLVASQEARKEPQQDDDAIMVIEDVPPLSPSKVTRATSEEVLNDPPSEQQQESPSSIPISTQALKKMPAAKSTNCIFDWNTEGLVIKAQSQVKMPLSSQYTPFICYKDDPESIQHALKELFIPLWQALHPSTTTDGDTMELQEQEYFDLFVFAWGSIRTWKMLDLKNKAMETKMMVYQLSQTSPEVFESLWTKTGRLNIIEETKAWKAANRMLGSKLKLQQQIMAKGTTFLEIMAKTASASATNASSTQQPTSPSISTPRKAAPMNPYAKKLASWRTNPVHQNMQQNHVTYSFVGLERSADPGCELFNHALTALHCFASIPI
jgi:hypothetical protein